MAGLPARAGIVGQHHRHAARRRAACRQAAPSPRRDRPRARCRRRPARAACGRIPGSGAPPPALKDDRGGEQPPIELRQHHLHREIGRRRGRAVDAAHGPGRAAPDSTSCSTGTPAASSGESRPRCRAEKPVAFSTTAGRHRAAWRRRSRPWRAPSGWRHRAARAPRPRARSASASAVDRRRCRPAAGATGRRRWGRRAAGPRRRPAAGLAACAGMRPGPHRSADPPGPGRRRSARRRVLQPALAQTGIERASTGSAGTSRARPAADRGGRRPAGARAGCRGRERHSELLGAVPPVVEPAEQPHDHAARVAVCST